MDLLIPPTFKFIHLIPYLLYGMLLFHLPYMGIMLVSSAFSVAYNKHKPQLSGDFIDLVQAKPGIWLVFGLLPALSLAVLYKMLFFNAGIPIHSYLLRITGLLIVGYALLFAYRRTANIIIGAAGTLVTLLYCFHFVNLMAFLVFPEKWPFHKQLLPFPLFSITPLFQFAIFMLMSLIITGAAILFIYYRWPEKKLAEDTPHYDFLKYHAYGFMLAGSLLMPLVLLLDLSTVPWYSLSIKVFVLTGLVMVTLFLIISTAVSQLRNYKEKMPRYTVISILLALLLFGLVIGKDRALQANANLETEKVLAMDAEKIMKAQLSVREEIYSKNMVIDAALGEQIYNQVCTSCHSFDKKVLGPAFNDVLPKYVANPENLIQFLKNPTKIDPAFTAMPNPGLTTMQLKSVVKFLMGKMGKSYPPEAEKKEEAKE